MVDCKTCENSYCHLAKTDDSHIVGCSGYKAPPKPRTNADRIRAMSDEELAAKIAAMCNSSKCIAENGSVCPLFQDCPMGTMGVRGETWLDWLRQPVKDGEN